jgi:hypothetical protein
MKLYAKISSVEKKEIVSENANGKREKKILHVAKMSTVDGVRIAIKSEEPFREFVIGTVLGVTMTVSQTKLEVPEPEEKA